MWITCAVGLDLHQPLDVHAAVLAHAPEVVAAEVDEHHVLGALLLVGEQLGGDRGVVLAARPGAGDRARGDVAAVDRQQRLGRGADDLEVLEVEEVHVRARVHGAQAAVDARTARPGVGALQRWLRDHLVGVAGVDVLDDPRDVGLERLAAHVRTRTSAPSRAPCVSSAGSGPASRARTCADRLDRAGVRGVDVGLVVEVGVGEDRDRVARGGRRRRSRRRASAPCRAARARPGWAPGRRSTARTQSKPKKPTAPPANGGRPGDLRLAHLGHGVVRERVRVSPVGQAPAQDALRAPADERPAADLLALLGGLEQERRAVAAQLQERGDRASRSPR